MARSEILEMQKATLVFLMMVPIAFGINSVYADDGIPAWVKGVANFWVDGNITDAEFVDAIEFLIENGIIKVDNSIKESIIAEPFPPFTETQNFDRKDTIDVKLTYDDIKHGDLSKINIDFINPQTQKIQEHIDYSIIVSKNGIPVFGPLPLIHTSTGSVEVPIEFNHEGGIYEMDVTVSGILFQPIPEKTISFDIMVAQEILSTISVYLDKSSYKMGETIKVSGEIANLKIDAGLTYLITNPDNNIIFLDQLSVDGNNKFSNEHTTSNSLWDIEGIYTIKVQYGNVESITSFEFLKDKPKNMINENNHPDTEISNNIGVPNNGINDITVIRNGGVFTEPEHHMAFDGGIYNDDIYNDDGDVIAIPNYRIGDTLTVGVWGGDTKIDNGTIIAFVMRSLSTGDIVVITQSEVDETGYAFFITELDGKLMPPYADYEVVATYGDLKERIRFHLETSNDNGYFGTGIHADIGRPDIGIINEFDFFVDSVPLVDMKREYSVDEDMTIQVSGKPGSSFVYSLVTLSRDTLIEFGEITLGESGSGYFTIDLSRESMPLYADYEVSFNEIYSIFHLVE